MWNYLLSVCLQTGVLCRQTWFETWGSKLILSNNLSGATLCILDTCLIVGLRPLMIILITISLSSKKCTASHQSRNFRVRRDMINVAQIKIVVLGWNLDLILSVLVWCGVTRRVSSNFIFSVVELVWGRMKYFKNQMIKSWDFHPCVNLHREKLFQLL